MPIRVVEVATWRPEGEGEGLEAGDQPSSQAKVGYPPQADAAGPTKMGGKEQWEALQVVAEWGTSAGGPTGASPSARRRLETRFIAAAGPAELRRGGRTRCGLAHGGRGGRGGGGRGRGCYHQAGIGAGSGYARSVPMATVRLRAVVRLQCCWRRRAAVKQLPVLRERAWWRREMRRMQARFRLAAREAEERSGRGRSAVAERPAAAETRRLAEALKRAEARCKEAEAEAAEARTALRTARAEADEKRTAAEAEAAKVKAAADGRHEEARRTAEEAREWRQAATKAVFAAAMAGKAKVGQECEGLAAALVRAVTQLMTEKAGVTPTVTVLAAAPVDTAAQAAEVVRAAAKTEEQAATGPTASECERRVPARTGGKQAKKARLRRQAAEARVDVAEWMAMRAAQTHLEEASGGGRLLQTRLSSLGVLPKRGAFVGEARAEWSFLQAARTAGIAVEDAEV